MNKKSMARILSGVAVGAAALGAYVFAIRPWHLRWGATEEEVCQVLPGDDLAPPNPNVSATHAITINAPAKDVWQWLVQIGQNRGGFYSYTWLENLVGCQMQNSNRIVPQWQNLKVGDEIFLHPEDPPVPVTAIDPLHALVLGYSWAFILKALDETTTRLIVRNQGIFSPDFGRVGNILYWRGLFEPAHFIMERKMMLGIKQHAEAEFTYRKKYLAEKATA